MRRNCKSILWIFSGIVLNAVPASAQEIETRGAYCNDNYFDSDGGGISACMEFALNRDADTIGIGLYGVSPEQKGDLQSDPLNEMARITGWYAREFERDNFTLSWAGRAGIEGGAADDLAIAVKEGMHGVFGYGNKSLESTKDTTLIVGTSGWTRYDLALSQSETLKTMVTPYVHGSLGNDVVEGGGGIMLALQPASATEGLGLLLPKNGAYAPTFGGDGIGIFGGIKAVLLDTFYEDAANDYVAEAGILGQTTLWDFAVIGLSASCTTKPYDGASNADCKATFQAGGLF